jgi:hypothetical protein
VEKEKVMRRLVTLTLAMLIVGCATPADRAAQVQRDVEEMIRTYGPGCERLGFRPETDQWRDCVLQLATKDSIERWGMYTRTPTTTSCLGSHGFFNCTTF